ncbi:MAG: PLP-dependent transferase, partial [Candidatus Didemnitutus sp.]|nr:PLP-dependent transferase [Candidatus Didemnitutus sp.]
LFATHGSRLAGLVTEAPTNPLLQCADLAAVATLARRHGVRVICDPSIASPLNVNVLPHADIVACSLTKYVSHEGDVMAGMAVVNSAGTDAAQLEALLPTFIDVPYARDLARLAAEISSAEEVVERINENTPQVVAFLQQHPAIDRVWWSLQSATVGNYRQIACTPDAVGAVVSFTLQGPLTSFYDRVALPKGPSFGMATTLLCPYLYLAHYDLLPHRSTSTELADAGIPPELIRLSVGAEPAAEIIAALAAALD